MRIDLKNLLAGALFVCIGAGFAVASWMQLAIGTTFQMGPGYFPLVLAGVMAALGLLIMLTAIGGSHSPIAFVPLRSLVLVLAAPALFGLTVRGLGLAPAIALGGLLCVLASRDVSFWTAIAITTGLTIFCVLVFSVGLGLPFQLIGPWLGG